MKPNFYLRASLALLAALVVVAGAVTAGAQTLSRTDPVADIKPVDAQADAGHSADDAAASAAKAAALQAAADKAAQEQDYFQKLDEQAKYYKAAEEQAYFAELERQADEAAAAQRAADEAAAAAEAAEQAAAHPAGAPDNSYWDRIAACETGGNWAMSGSQFSGGVGFANTTWNSWGGREFAANAGSATREQQITVANRVATQGYGSVAPVGYSGWGCAKHSVGYP
jgi:membrane protein involved in colicin uptake